MLHRQDPLLAHTSAVDTLAAAGITPPPEWEALRQRITATPADTMLARFTAAVLDGNPDADLAALQAGALAETLATPQQQAIVNNAVRAAAVRRLRDLYAPHAAPNYDKVADAFDAAATKLAKAVAVIDPNTDPATVISADAKTRSAWADAELAATDLARLVPILQAAAELAGVSTETREKLLALTVDATGLHRRRVWEAFDQDRGRGGRWAALLAAGATIRAHRPITELQPYRLPRPMEERWETINRGQSRRVIVDPEDDETADTVTV